MITGYHGVFGEMSVRDDSGCAGVDDSNKLDTLQRLGIAAHSQPEPQRSQKTPKRQCEQLEPLTQSHPNFMEDSLLQISPQISIPRKQMLEVKSKQHTKEIDKAFDGKTYVSKVHCYNYIKYENIFKHILCLTCLLLLLCSYL